MFLERGKRTIGGERELINENGERKYAQKHR